MSRALLDWAGENRGRHAIKVGETWNPRDREIWLSGRDPRRGGTVRACAGHRDWKVVAEAAVETKTVALDLEARFKASFAPVEFGRVGAGESDLVLLPDRPLVGAELAALDDDVRRLYLEGRAKMWDGVRFAPEPEDHHVGADEDDDRDRNDFYRDEEDDRAERLDRAARAREDGIYYED